MRPSHQKSGIIKKNVQKKNGIVSHLIMNVGIKNNIMNGIMTINKKKNNKVGIIDELIMENDIQTKLGIIKQNHHMKKHGFHHGIYIKETSI